MEDLKHIKEIENELKVYGLTTDDLTEEELKERSHEIEIEKAGGFILDGVTVGYSLRGYGKEVRQGD